MHPLRRRAWVMMMAALVLPMAAACSSTADTSAPACPATATTVGACTAAVVPVGTAVIDGQRFDQAAKECVPNSDAAFDNGRWLVSVDGGGKNLGDPVPPGHPITIGLWRKSRLNAKDDPTDVVVRVATPSGALVSARGRVGGNPDWFNVPFPSGFTPATDTGTPGAYVIDWSTADGRHLVCDGFVVAAT